MYMCGERQCAEKIAEVPHIEQVRNIEDRASIVLLWVRVGPRGKPVRSAQVFEEVRAHTARFGGENIKTSGVAGR